MPRTSEFVRRVLDDMGRRQLRVVEVKQQVHAANSLCARIRAMRGV